ncbi:MAG: AEC family transporter [Rhodoferax sp.]|nr:AEC family transporter [Rhodoferax sp.]
MDHPVLSALLPVMLLIAIGWVAARAGWIRSEATRDLSNLVFMVLGPALLFRTMSGARLAQFDFRPVALYFLAAGLLFGAVLAWRGLSRQSVLLALTATFSNTLAIGTPLVALAYGQAGLVLLFALVSVHALVLLTLATLALEWAVAREAAASRPAGGARRHPLRTVLEALRGGIVHPVPLPILAGLLFARTGGVMPPVLDRPLQLLGNAFGPLALVLVGVSLARVSVGVHWRAALGLSLLKNLALPGLVAGLGLLLGLGGLPLAVMVVAASLPVGANVFMFSQRYGVAEDLVTATMALSTALAVATLSLVMALLGRL